MGIEGSLYLKVWSIKAVGKGRFGDSEKPSDVLRRQIIVATFPAGWSPQNWVGLVKES